MSEQSEDLKTFKAPRVDITVEKVYTVSVAGKKLGSFREVGEMCDMKQLTGNAGVIVIDCPNKLEEVLASLFSSRESEPFKASVIKASPAIINAMQERIEEVRAEQHDAHATPDGMKDSNMSGPCPVGEPTRESVPDPDHEDTEGD